MAPPPPSAPTVFAPLEQRGSQQTVTEIMPAHRMLRTRTITYVPDAPSDRDEFSPPPTKRRKGRSIAKKGAQTGVAPLDVPTAITPGMIISASLISRVHISLVRSTRSHQPRIQRLTSPRGYPHADPSPSVYYAHRTWG